MATVAENSNSNKRGRPDIYTRTYNERADFVRDLYANLAVPDNVESKRGRADQFYIMEANLILGDYDKEAFKRDYFTSKGNLRYSSILIQIGRMYRQDNFSAEDCVTISRSAIELIENGYTVHQVAQMIRNYRITHRP